jgi:hypothetical protein
MGDTWPFFVTVFSLKILRGWKLRNPVMEIGRLEYLFIKFAYRAYLVLAKHTKIFEFHKNLLFLLKILHFLQLYKITFKPLQFP